MRLSKLSRATGQQSEHGDENLSLLQSDMRSTSQKGGYEMGYFLYVFA